MEMTVFESAGLSVQAVRAGRADIGFFAIDPQRSEGIRFTAPYVLIEGAYLVRNDSPLRDNAQVDHAGTRVMVGQKSVYDLYLTRELKAAQILRSPTSPSVVDEFLARDADVAAGVKQQLEADAARLGGLRLLPGRFMVIEQAMGLPADHGDAAQDALAGFVRTSAVIFHSTKDQQSTMRNQPTSTNPPDLALGFPVSFRMLLRSVVPQPKDATRRSQ